MDNSAGGFCGIAYAGGDFIGCYSQGLVTQPGSGSGFIGCYFGHSIIDEYHSNSDAIRVYWDTETSGCEEGWGVAYFTDPLEVDYYQPNGFVTCKTTNEMYQQETYIPTS